MNFPWEDITRKYEDVALCHIISEFNVGNLIAELELVESLYSYKLHPTKTSNGGFTVIPIRNNTGKLHNSDTDFRSTPTSIYTEIAELVPHTVKFIESFGLKLYQARYIGLIPGALVTHHVDYPKDPNKRRVARINVPLRTNNKSFIRIGHETHQFELGKAYWIDSHVPHCVANMGDNHRIHFIFDFDFYEFLDSNIAPPGSFERRVALGEEVRNCLHTYCQDRNAWIQNY